MIFHKFYKVLQRVRLKCQQAVRQKLINKRFGQPRNTYVYRFTGFFMILFSVECSTLDCGFPDWINFEYIKISINHFFIISSYLYNLRSCLLSGC